MKDETKTKKEIIKELQQLRRQVTKLEKSEHERKKAEEELRESEERYRAVFENTGNATIIIEEDMTISLANHEMEKLTGYSREEVEGKKSWTEFIIKKDLERMKKYHESRRINPASAPRNYESGLIDKQGNIKDVSLTIAMISGTKRSIASLLDITERKKVEEMLIESEEKYRALTENISDIAYSLDRNGILTHISPQTKKYDVAPETLISRNLLEIVHPEDRENIAKEYQRALETGEEFTSIFRILNAKGRVYWLEDLGKIQRDKDGNITGLAGVLRDITERKQAEEKLRANEQELELLLEYLPGMVFFKDSNFRYRRVNPAFTQLHKITQEEIIGKKIGAASLLNAEFAASDDLEVIESGKVSSRIIEFPDDTGGSRWQQITKVPIKDENGKIRGILGVGMDISDIIKSQEELKLKSEMLDQARNGIIVSDTNGNFVYANKVVLEERGYTQEEFLKLNVRDLVVPPGPGNFDEWWQQVVEKGYFMGEYEIRCKDGSLIPVEAILTRAKSGENDFVISVVHDITERKQMAAESAELERKAQVASRLASVGELASGIAHEINNPLTGVVGFAQLLAERKDLPEDVKEQLKIIHDGGQRVSNIIKGLLSFARQSKTKRTYVDINEVVERTIRLRQYGLETSNIELIKRFDPELPWTIADAGQLQQVFINLVVNAEQEMVKAHGKGRLEIKTELAGEKIRISFKDDGPGISKENLGKIFDPFFTTKEVGKGTGLGLSLSHGIIVEHGGELYAKSELDKGASFVVELPLLFEEEQVEEAEDGAEAEEVVKGRILVVDYEKVVRQYLNRILSKMGHRVELLADGEEALERVKAAKYNLIFMGINMPGMDGREFYRRVREIAQSLAERVVFITGDVMGEETRDFILKTGVIYITKPIDAGRLRWVVNKVLGGSMGKKIKNQK